MEIWTDGSCINYKDKKERAKKGDGGWAFIVTHYGEERVYRAGYMPPPQTNQTMELYAVLNALKWVVWAKLEGQRVIIRSDSMYAINGMISQFRHVAALTDFEGEANGDIWREMHKLAEKLPRLRFRHVKGHAGTKYNEMADRMASHARKSGRKLFTGKE